MSNKINTNNPINLARIGNFTKNAVKTFENGILNKHNYLEKINKNQKKIKTITKIRGCIILNL